MFVFINQYFKTILLCFLSVLLMACQTTAKQSTESVPIYTALYIDEAFTDHQSNDIESEEEVFALDDEMRSMVENTLLPIRDHNKRARKLLLHLFSKDNVDLAYKSTANLTAAQAYHSQMANCMSLTIMAYALAKEAKLDVKFQDIKVPEYWVRHGEYNMLTGHVNLVVTEPRDANKIIVYGKELLQIDFDSAIFKKSFPKKVVGKNTVLAMYYNNKGAEALVAHNYSLAYSYFKEATLVDPLFSSAWGNLGILYKFAGHKTYAIDAYRYAIDLDSENLTALNNLSFILNSLGQYEQAKAIETKLHIKRINNPYYHALLADEAFFNGDNLLALKHYRKAIKMNKKIHEFHFGIAKVHYALNNVKSAEKAMKRALYYNKTNALESEYVAKLNFLQQAGLDE